MTGELLAIEEQQDALAFQIKQLDQRASVLREAIIEMLSALSLEDGVVKHGRKWRVERKPQVNCLKSDRRKVLEIADRLGHDILQIGTSTLKSILAADAKENGLKVDANGNASIVAGSEYEGLLSEYWRPELSVRKS